METLELTPHLILMKKNEKCEQRILQLDNKNSHLFHVIQPNTSKTNIKAIREPSLTKRSKQRLKKATGDMQSHGRSSIVHKCTIVSELDMVLNQSIIVLLKKILGCIPTPITNLETAKIVIYQWLKINLEIIQTKELLNSTQIVSKSTMSETIMTLEVNNLFQKKLVHGIILANRMN